MTLNFQCLVNLTEYPTDILKEWYQVLSEELTNRERSELDSLPDATPDEKDAGLAGVRTYRERVRCSVRQAMVKTGRSQSM